MRREGLWQAEPGGSSSRRKCGGLGPALRTAYAGGAIMDRAGECNWMGVSKDEVLNAVVFEAL